MLKRRRIYLDAAAGMAGNPSSPHQEGRRSRETLESARTDIARLVEAKPDDVIFTSGATEANALAILGAARAHEGLTKSEIHALYLPSAHASIVENMKMLEGEGVMVEPLPIKTFQVDCEALTKMIRPETVLVSMDAVCGETGVIWNTREVASALRGHPMSLGHRMSTLLHVDASQAPLTEKISRAHFNADLLTLDASKVGEVRGIGALIAHRTIPLAPLYVGGGQERGLRPGSEAPELARAFARGLEAAAADRERLRASAEHARERLIVRLRAEIAGLLVNEGQAQAPHILNISLPGRDTDYLVMLMDEAGFALSTRSACETDSEEGSRAVYALTGDARRAKATLRISWDARVGARELDRFAAVLIRAVAFVGGRG